MYQQISGDLVKLFSEEARAVTARAQRDIANRAGAAMVTAAKAHTPTKTGKTRASFEQIDVHRVPDGFASGVQPNYWKAWLIEHGVAEHDLKLKKKGALATPDGPRGGAHHPGQHGTHAVAKAAAEVEVALPVIAAPTMTAWAHAVERIGGT